MAEPAAELQAGFAETTARAPEPRQRTARHPPDPKDIAGLARAAEHVADVLTRPPPPDPEPWQEGAELPFASVGPSGHRSRMRAKILERGPDALADYELLEMLLFFPQPKADTKPLAKAAINRFRSYPRVLTASTRDLLATPGFGVHTAAAIRLVQASAIRLARAEIVERPILTNWDTLMSYLNALMVREQVEQFRALFLDNRNRLLADEALSRGTVNHTPVYPREVVKRALELHATALILVHNHPSGDPTPSRDDIEMTREVKDAAAVLSIVVHDHIIIGNGTWTSLRKEGLL